jgi:hypothetical protein
MILIDHQTLVAIRQSVLTSHKQAVVGQLLETDSALALHGVIDGVPIAHVDLGFGMTQAFFPPLSIMSKDSLKEPRLSAAEISSSLPPLLSTMCL